MNRKERFFSSDDFESLKQTNNLEELVLKLIARFEEKGFRFYPEWRTKHKTGKDRKNFTFKVEQPADSINENLITIYPQSGHLKVEIYRGQTNKTYYKVDPSNVDDSAQLKPLLDDAKAVYNSISVFSL